MQYDYEVIALTSWSVSTKALLGQNSYFATADLNPTTCHPSADYELLKDPATQAETVTGTFSSSSAWGITGGYNGDSATGIVNGGFAFTPSSAISVHGTSGALTLFFVVTGTMLDTINISINKISPSSSSSTALLPATIVPPENTNWALKAGTTPGTLSFFPPTQGLYFLKLSQLLRPPALLCLSSIKIVPSNPTLTASVYLQAFSCGIAAGRTLRSPTLHSRHAPHRDVHAVYDSGAIMPSVQALQKNKKPARLSSSAGGVGDPGGYFMVSRFEVKDPAASPLVLHTAHTHFCSGDTSVASATLVGKVRVDAQPVSVVATVNGASQSFWKNASNLATTSFTISEGLVSNTVAVFLTPLTFVASSGNTTGVLTLATTSTSITITDTDSASPVTLQLPTTAESPLVAGIWTLAPNDTYTAMTLTASSATLTLPVQFPYIEFTYVGSGGSPPPIATIQSTAIPIQGLSLSSLAASVSTATVGGACFSYEQVKAAGLVLFTDAYGAAYKFGDPDASFTLENASLNLVQDMNSHARGGDVLIFNQGQTEPSVNSTSVKMVEKRTADGDAWFIVDETDPKASPSGQYVATRYSFVPLVVAEGSTYAVAGGAPVGGSVIMLYAQNMTTGGVVAESGFVACDTSTARGTGGGTGFAATSVNSATPLLTLAQAQQQGIQWGVVQKNVDVAQSGLGAAAPPLRCIGLVYRDNTFATTAPALLSIAASPPGCSTPCLVTSATNPLRVPSQMAGEWIAHGVWTQPPPQNADNAWSAEVLYNPETMLVEPMDKYNVVTGSGFTATNTHIQWLCRQPIRAEAELLADTALLLKCRQAIQDTETQIAAVVLLAHEQLLGLPPQSTALAIATESYSVLTQLTLQAQAEAQRALGTTRVVVAQAILNDLQSNILRNVTLRQKSFLESTKLTSLRADNPPPPPPGGDNNKWRLPAILGGTALVVLLAVLLGIVFWRRRKLKL